jgi:hypothetical protein
MIPLLLHRKTSLPQFLDKEKFSHKDCAAVIKSTEQEDETTSDVTN